MTQSAREASAQAARTNPLPQVQAAVAPLYSGPAGDSMSPPVSSSPDVPARQVSDNQVVDQQESIKRDVDKVTGGEPVIKSVGEPKEVGFWEWVEHKVSNIDWSEVGHTILDVVGMIPVVGEIADGINAVWYLAEGDYLNAALSAAALVPFAGAAATGMKLIGKGLQKYGDEAVGLARSCIRANSFVAGTRVLLADGSTKQIEDVQLGDEVQATDPTTGETGPRAVTDLIVGTGEKELVQVTLDTDGAAGDKTDVVTATDGHPFWVSSRGAWREAKDLMPGDDVRTAEGSSLEVVSTTVRTEYLTVYNLTVDGLHTYHVLVGKSPVLVHNSGPCPPTDADALPGIVFRALAKGEDPALGLTARSPGAIGVTPLSHVAGKGASPWISTTKLPDTAFGKYNNGNGVVAIDLSRVPGLIEDVSGGFPGKGRLDFYARKDQEVLIFGEIPASAIIGFWP